MAQVLIVDDDPDIQVLIKAAARHFSNISIVSAFTVEDAKKALDMVDDLLYVTLDWKLPDGTGQEVIEYMRKRNINIPIVLYTGCPAAVEYAKKEYPGVLALEKTQTSALLNFIEMAEAPRTHIAASN